MSKENQLIQALEEQTDKQIKGIHTAIPGTILSYNAGTSKVTAQPSVQFKVEDGRRVSFPPIVEVPVQFPCGMGSSAGLTFPLTAGDSCLLVFSETALDDWGGGESEDMRAFDLSDAMCIPGLYFGGTQIAITHPDDVCLMYGNSGIRITADGKIIIKASSEITINGSRIDLNT